MQHVFELVGKERTVQLFGIKLVGVNGDNAKKLLITISDRISYRAAHEITPALSGIVTEPA